MRTSESGRWPAPGPVGPFQLIAERETEQCLDQVQLGVHQDAGDAVTEIEALERTGRWPRHHEPMLVDLGTGTKWLYTGEGSLAAL